MHHRTRNASATFRSMLKTVFESDVRKGDQDKSVSSAASSGNRIRASDAYAPTASKTKLREGISRMSNEQLAVEMMRFGRHAARAEHLVDVLDELLRRASKVPHGMIRDAIFLAGTCGLHRHGVALHIARARTHFSEPNFALHDSVIDCAFHVGSIESLVTVCESVKPKMITMGKSEVPSELALYRAVWRLVILSVKSARDASEKKKDETPQEARRRRLARCRSESSTAAPQLITEGLCMDGAKRIIDVIISYNSDILHRLGKKTPGKADEILTPDDLFTDLIQRLRRLCLYGPQHGELQFALLVYQRYMSPVKRFMSPTTLYTALIRVARSAQRPDYVYALFLEYLETLVCLCAVKERRGISAIANASMALEIASEALAYERVPPLNLVSLLDTTIHDVEEIVIHTCLAALNACGAYERAVSIAEALLSPSLHSRYIPSASVVAHMMKAVGEVRSAATADRLVKYLISSESESTPSPHEMFTSLIGLAKCGTPAFTDIFEACQRSELLSGDVEERCYINLQHALNTINIRERLATIENTMKHANVPFSERMMVLTLQCLLRTEADDFVDYFRRFVELRGEPKLVWIELLVLWADRRRYTIDPHTRQWIVDDVLAKANLLDLRSSHVDNFRNQLAQLLHDATQDSRGRFAVNRSITDGPECKDPRLHFLISNASVRRPLAISSDTRYHGFTAVSARRKTDDGCNEDPTRFVHRLQTFSVPAMDLGYPEQRKLPRPPYETWQDIEALSTAAFVEAIRDNRQRYLQLYAAKRGDEAV